MDYDILLSDGWNRHATDPEGVLATLGDAIPAPPENSPALAALIVHVAGEHLGRWSDGIALLERLPEDSAVWRGIASLHRCAGDDEAAERALGFASRDGTPEASHHARADAVAAAALTAHRDLPRATALYERACALADALPPSDPAQRALAVASNNLACALELADRDADADTLLRTAATNARRYWGIAGTWLHAERAEYRLAMTHLALGEPATALAHAQACLAIVLENGGDALERLFAHEAAAKAHHALGDAAAAHESLAATGAALAEVEPSMREFCSAEVEKLRHLIRGA